MDITGQYRIAMPREAVWQALMDPAILGRCIPGCENLEQTAPGEYRARVALAIGPVRASFDTELSLMDLHEPESYRLAGAGRGGAVGFGRGEARVELSITENAATLLSYSAGFQVGGRLAQLGSRLVLGTTRKLVDEFFANLVSEMDAGAQRLDAVPVAASARAGRRRVLIAVSVGLIVLGLVLWRLLFSGTAR